MKNNSVLILFLLITTILNAQQPDPLEKLDNYGQQMWVDNILKSMTVDQKIGQLFMVPAFSNKDKKHTDYIEEIINKYEIGGLIFMQGTAEGHATLINKYQSLSKIPLLISLDGEWGLDMRIKKTIAYPFNMALGAIRNNDLLEEYGESLGRQVKRLGIHVNFAPVVDVNTNPLNPVIGNRSFGEDKYNVTEKAIAFTKGLQSQNIIACAKHFPGHGDTSQDSHKTLPTVDLSLERMDSVELYPYKKLFEKGIASVITAHLSVPSLEPNISLPSSVSYNIVTGLLKEKMQFNGLIFTDALNMKGATDFVKPGEIDLNAFMAGNDILLFPESVSAGIAEIKKAIENKQISIERLDHSVKKILKAKYWVGLNNYKPVDLSNLSKDLNSTENKVLNHKLVENSITLVKNSENCLPIIELESNRIAYVKFGEDDNKTFIDRLNDYTKVDVVSDKNLDGLLRKLKNYKTVIIGFHTSLGAYANYKIPDRDLVKLQAIARNHKVILDVFASPYSLLNIKSFTNIETIVVSYQNTLLAQDISAQMIFGALDMKGKLPVSIHEIFPVGHGLESSNIQRLGYSIPEQVGMDGEKLNKIDSIANVVIDSAMAPGLQVLVARYGKVVYRKSFGYHTDKKVRKVKNTDLYDLASLTKILGALPLIMKAEEEGRFTLDSPLGNLWPTLKNTDKDTLTIKESLSHFAQLQPWIPFFKFTMDSITKKPSSKYYRHKGSRKFPVEVAKNLYLRKDYKDSIFQMIAASTLLEKKEYKYSGLIFYLFKDYLEKEYKRPMDVSDDLYFYKPLGARSLTYKPLEKFYKEDIVPSEKDENYRNQLLQGYVHDQGAAMLGGVNGNAGLFSNANDVAKMMQMYMQEGYYGGKQFLKSETIKKFNQRYFEKDSVRRGLGFDKPQLDPEVKATCGCVSSKSFGHSGFTGTFAWADPETQLVYVFLSNRVYPTADNAKLIEQDIRTKTQQIIQDAIMEE